MLEQANTVCFRKCSFASQNRMVHKDMAVTGMLQGQYNTKFNISIWIRDYFVLTFTFLKA